jgi:hypothetical protein
LVLQNNAGNDLSVSPAVAAFTFSSALANAVAYAVTVKTQPSGQTCSVTNANGIVNNANVTNISVICVNIISANSFSFSTMWANRLNTSHTLNGTITSGTLITSSGSYPMTGTASITISAATATTFGGQSALVSSMTQIGSSIINGTTYPINIPSQFFSTKNYVPLGMTYGNEYRVMQGTPTIPPTARVGDGSAVIGTYNRYTDSTMSTFLGTAQISFVPDVGSTASTIYVTFNETDFDTTNRITAISSEFWSMDTSGNLTFVNYYSARDVLNYLGTVGGLLSYWVQ